MVSLRRLIHVSTIGLLIFLQTACGTSQSTLISTPISSPTLLPATSSDASALPPSPSSTPVKGSGLIVPTQQSQPPYRIEISPGYKIEQLLRPSLLMPTDIKVGPDGRIFFYEMDGRRIVELGYDGTISTFVELEQPCNGLLINSLGELFTFQGDQLVKISPAGEKTTLFQITNVRGWAFDSQDDLYMIVEDILSGYTLDGEKTIVATGVEGGAMAISPSGDFYLASGSRGEILKVTRDGRITTHAAGFARDAFNIGFDPQGHLYQNANYFTRVSLDDGSLSLPILRDYNVLLVSRPFAFTPSGEAIFIGPTSNNAFKASIQDGTMSVLVAGIGNSRALAFDPAGNLFMGASNEFPLVPGRVIQLFPNGEFTEYATGFFTIRDMVFDDLGNIFVSDIDNEGQNIGRLIKITPDGLHSQILSGYYDLSSMVHDPNNGDILAFEQHSSQLLRITQAGTVEIIPVDFGGEAATIDLSLDGSGDLIALVVFQENYNTGPVHRGLYRIPSDNQAALITDIDTPMATSEDDVFVAPSGDIYVVGPEEHPNFRLLKISPLGDVTVVARLLPYDTLSLVINNAGDIYFTCSAGLFMVSQDQ